MLFLPHLIELPVQIRQRLAMLVHLPIPKPQRTQKPQQAVIQHGDEMGEFERRAMEKMMQKGLYKEGE